MKKNGELFVCLAVVLLLVGLYFSQQVEKFGVYCRNCGLNGWRGQTDCYECNNCGWCIDPNGYGSCVTGNANGSLFADCRSYFYKGACIYGPECGYNSPIYITPIWYNPFTWWGPRRYRRRYYGGGWGWRRPNRVPRRAGGPGRRRRGKR